MKELSVEEKAKRYDEAIARMSRAFNSNRCTLGFMNEIFPELKESEDERIRERLIEFFKDWGKTRSHCWSISISDILAWLEKQAEQNPTDNVEPKFKVGDRITKSSKKSCPVHSSIDDTICEVAEVHDTCYILNTKEGRIQEPFEWQDHYELVKPAWSEEDEKFINDIKESLLAYKIIVMDNDMELANYIEKEIAWLKSLKDRVQPQPKQEWSEEDQNALEDVRESVVHYWGGDTQDILLYWLKSIKQRIGG